MKGGDLMPKDIDTLLSRRMVPDHSPFLAERIIAEARTRKRGGILAELWRIFSEDFILPQPAFAMMVVLFIGATVGFNYETQSFFASKNSDIFSSSSLADGDYDDGALL
jgi:hypothetical protein